jgi:hypothetical protein
VQGCWCQDRRDGGDGGSDVLGEGGGLVNQHDLGVAVFVEHDLSGGAAGWLGGGGAVEQSRARLYADLANGGLDRSVHFAQPDGRHASLRRLVCDLIEEYGRHTGHADLLREAVDGRGSSSVPGVLAGHAGGIV